MDQLSTSITLILFIILLGLIPAAIAKSKGRNFITWWYYGVFLFMVALFHAIIMKPDNYSLEKSAIASGEFKKCSYCAELIKSEAVVCRFCGRDIDHSSTLTM